MHYSRILASVALVAVACGAPAADKSSSSSSSYSPTVTKSATSTASIGHGHYKPTVTPSVGFSHLAPPAPSPFSDGAGDSYEYKYDFASKDGPDDFVDESSGAVDADDVAFDYEPDAEAVETTE